MDSDDEKDDVNFDFDPNDAAAAADKLLSLKEIIQPQSLLDEAREFICALEQQQELPILHSDKNIQQPEEKYRRTGNSSANMSIEAEVQPTTSAATFELLPKNTIRALHQTIEEKINYTPYKVKTDSSLPDKIHNAEQAKKRRSIVKDTYEIALRLAHQVPHLLEEITLLQSKIPHPETNDTQNKKRTNASFNFFTSQQQKRGQRRSAAQIIFEIDENLLSLNAIEDLYQSFQTSIKKELCVEETPGLSKNALRAKRETARRALQKERTENALKLTAQIPNLLDEIDRLEAVSSTVHEMRP